MKNIKMKFNIIEEPKEPKETEEPDETDEPGELDEPTEQNHGLNEQDEQDD